MHEVQLVLADPTYAAGIREALTRTGPWSITSRDTPDLSQRCVLVLDEEALERMASPLTHPERVVLIARQDARHLAQAWDAGIVSVVSDEEAPGTVLLAIMAAALRVPRRQSHAPDPEPALPRGGSDLRGRNMGQSGSKHQKLHSGRQR